VEHIYNSTLIIIITEIIRQEPGQVSIVPHLGRPCHITYDKHALVSANSAHPHHGHVTDETGRFV